MKTLFVLDHQSGLGRLDAARDQEEVYHLEVSQMSGCQNTLAFAVFVELGARCHYDRIFDHDHRVIVDLTAACCREHNALVRGLIGLYAARQGMCQKLVPFVDHVAHLEQNLVERSLLKQDAVLRAVLSLHTGVVCYNYEIQSSFHLLLWSAHFRRILTAKKISGSVLQKKYRLNLTSQIKTVFFSVHWPERFRRRSPLLLWRFKHEVARSSSEISPSPVLLPESFDPLRRLIAAPCLFGGRSLRLSPGNFILKYLFLGKLLSWFAVSLFYP